LPFEACRRVGPDPVWGRQCRDKVISSPGRRAMFAAVVDSSRKDPSVREIYFREEELQMPTGTIKKLVSDRGFGFIAAEDGKEYFFHRTGLDSSVNFDSLAGGERVSFEIEASQKGPRANRIKLA
jgi:CspA family cold shock protein